MTKTNNPIQPIKTITLDGAEHELRFRHRDFATAVYRLKQQGWTIHLLGPLAKEFWTDFVAPVDDDKQLAIFDQFKVSVLLYTGLIHEDPRLEFSTVQDLITLTNTDLVTSAVVEAVVEALCGASPETTETPEAEDGPPLPAASGGAVAGPPPAMTSDSELIQSPETDQTSSGISPQPSIPSSTSDT